MYTLKLGQKVVGFATSDIEMESKIAQAAANGYKVTATKIKEEVDYFKVRDYDQEFRDLIEATKAALNGLEDFPYGQLSMSEYEYKELAKPIIDRLEDRLAMEVARYGKIDLYRGDYGYGRSLEWSSSNCYGEEPSWVSSSANC